MPSTCGRSARSSATPSGRSRTRSRGMDAGNRVPPEGVREPRVEATLTEPLQAQDESLVLETLSGSQASFQLLVERYQERIFSLARHYTRNPVDVEDLVQDTFLKAYSRLDTFQRQSSFFTWL